VPVRPTPRASWRPLAVAIVAALSWSLPVSAGPTACPTCCEEESAYKREVVAADGGAGPDVEVPLVIHIMERPGHPCEVRRHWTVEKVNAIFGPTTNGQAGVNHIWAQAGIRIVVRDIVLRGEYAPPAAISGTDPGSVRAPHPPDDGVQEEAFSQIVSVHTAGKMNVYLWALIYGSAAGYGRSTRTPPGKATVWLDNDCPRTLNPAQCAALAAHEIGHALGLYEVGGSDACDGVNDAYRDLCQRLVAQCHEVPEDQRLMHPEYIVKPWTGLCPAERDEARKMATGVN
jgi:hypothetical protein